MKPDLIHETIGELFTNSKRIAIFSHIRPDGDAVGSLLGLGFALKDAGKDVQMILPDGVPAQLRSLEGASQIKRKLDGVVDLRVVLDVSDLIRLGDPYSDQTPDLNIDHHITNLRFAKINLVDDKAVATSAILAECMPLWGLRISELSASALLTGIITDTLGFRTSNMNPSALRLAANLMEAGADLPDLYHHALNQRSFEAARYWSCGLDRLQRENGLIWTTLTLADRSKVSYPGNDDADLVNILSSIQDYHVVVIFVEQKGGKVKVSWRSQPGVDVSQLALYFGGGGHPAASGAEIAGELEEVQKSVLDKTIEYLNTCGEGIQGEPVNG